MKSLLQMWKIFNILDSPFSFAIFAAGFVLFLLPSFVTPLSLPSEFDLPSDPCLEIAKQSGTKNGSFVAAKVRCPRYHPDVFDGRVCLGCFCDEYEISNWDRFSFAEKSYALEDASDRAQAVEAEDIIGYSDGSIPVEELKRQASVWRNLAAKASKNANTPSTADESTPDSFNNGIGEKSDLKDTKQLKQDLKEDKLFSSSDIDAFVGTSDTFAVTIPIASTVSVSTSAPTITATRIPKFGSAETLETKNDLFLTEPPNVGSTKQQTMEQQQPPPPTPCTRICRYNANCYDGKVCIGCFRDTHDIAQWSSMSDAEKMFSLEDAADRCHDLSERGKDTDTCFEGGITEAALRTQALQWGTWRR